MSIRKRYKEVGMGEEIEGILDSLWEFNKNIQNLFFPEIELYKWDFKYGVEDWRKIIEILENNPTQTAYNYYRTEEKSDGNKELVS